MPREKESEVPAVSAGTYGRNKVKQSIKIELPTEEKAEIARDIARKQNRAYGNWVSWLIIQEVEKYWAEEQEARSLFDLTSDENKKKLSDIAEKADVDVYTLFKDLLEYGIEQLKSGELTVNIIEEQTESDD